MSVMNGSTTFSFQNTPFAKLLRTSLLLKVNLGFHGMHRQGVKFQSSSIPGIRRNPFLSGSSLFKTN